MTRKAKRGGRGFDVGGGGGEGRGRGEEMGRYPLLPPSPLAFFLPLLLSLSLSFLRGTQGIKLSFPFSVPAAVQGREDEEDGGSG